MAAAVIAKWEKIDVLVHLVGAFAGGQSVADTDDATLEQMLEVNLRAAFHMFRAVLPGMRARGAGRILAIGSRTAVDPQPMVGAYSASKAALVSLVRTIALENKDRGISANVILPGTMDTPGIAPPCRVRILRNGCSPPRSPACWCIWRRTRHRRSAEP